MARQMTEKELLDLEKQYWQAMKDRDVETALRLTDDPCLVAGATGVDSVAKDRLATIMQKATYKLERFELDNVKFRLLRDDVAILSYKVHEDLVVDGKALHLDAAESSTWVRRNGSWLCALHTESLAGDPYGRDREKKTERPHREEVDEGG